MKFDSTVVNVNDKEIVIVAVDTDFFGLEQEQKGQLVRASSSISRNLLY